MAVYGVVRVGFQENAGANNKARYALTGTIKAGEAGAPFQRKNTGLFTAEGADNAAVATALAKLLKVLVAEAATIDMVSITVTRSDDAAAVAEATEEEEAAVKQAVEG